MTIYKIIKDVDEAIPHNVEQLKSKILMPTYSFVTSANFALSVIAVALLLTIILLQFAFAYSQDEIDRNGIKDIKVNDPKQSTSGVTFDYYHNKYSKESAGTIVTSDLDVVPVQIDADNVKYRD